MDSDISQAKAVALAATGKPFAIALDNSEFFSLIAEETITSSESVRFSGACPTKIVAPSALKALDALDDVIALIRASKTPDEARSGLMKLLSVDEIQANAILDMQLRRIAALERQKITDEHTELMKEIKELTVILASPEKQRAIIKEELQEVANKYGNERRTQIVAGDTDLSVEDLIPDQVLVAAVVVPV